MPELTRGPNPMPFLPRHLSSFPLFFICQLYKPEFYQQCVRHCLYQNHQTTNLSMEEAYTCVSLTKPAHAHAVYTTVQIPSLLHVSAITSPSSRCTTLETHQNTIIGRDSPVGIATRHRLDSPGIESRWRQDFPHLFTASCTVCTGSFPGVKRPGRSVDHPTPSRAGILKKWVELYSPPGPSWPVIGRTLPLPYLGTKHKYSNNVHLYHRDILSNFCMVSDAAKSSNIVNQYNTNVYY
jgi:hypothetical protein